MRPWVLALVLAGCTVAPPPEPGDAPLPAALSWSASCDHGCFEPTVAVLEDRIVATSAEGWLYVWHDDEVQRLPPPSLPDGRVFLEFGDETVDAAPDGSLYYSRLASTGTVIMNTYQPLYSAVHVARSEDGGVTWPQNALVAVDVPEGPHDVPLYPDRQWLTFEPDGTVHLTFQRPTHVTTLPQPVFATQIVAARAPPGTVDFGPLDEITHAEARVGAGSTNGNGLAREGVLWSPMWTRVDGRYVLAVAEVGQEVRHHIITDTHTGGWFPVLRYAQGVFQAFWWHDGAIWHATSPDAAVWSEPHPWSPQGVVASPWAVIHDDEPILAYIADGAVWGVLEGAEPRRVGNVSSSGSRPGNTDMAYVVPAPEGPLFALASEKTNEIRVVQALMGRTPPPVAPK